MQWLPVLEVTTSDSPVTQGPSTEVPGHSCWKGYNLQAVWAEAEFRKNPCGFVLRKTLSCILLFRVVCECCRQLDRVLSTAGSYDVSAGELHQVLDKVDLLSDPYVGNLAFGHTFTMYCKRGLPKIL